MSLVHNEQIKLTASWANGLATAIVAAGAFAPIAALVYGLSSPTVPAGKLTMFMSACIGIGAALHFGARAFLRRLRE